MMTPAEMVKFHIERSMSAAKAMLAAQAAGNFALAAQNARQLFKNRLMTGLLTWRLGGDSRSAVEEAVAGFVAGRHVLQQIDPGAKVDQVLPVPNALLVAFLVDKDPESSPDVAQSDEHDACERRLDWLLVVGDPREGGSRRGGRRGRRARVKEALQARGRHLPHLLRDPAPCAAGGPAERPGPDGRGALRQRARDSFYSGGEATEGGGPDNAYVVDYRLAAVLKKVGTRARASIAGAGDQASGRSWSRAVGWAMPGT